MKHNFGAGPSILPQEVFREASEGIIDYNNSGLSILEISHRSKAFEAIIEEAEQLVRELLSIPNGYSVLFLQGGASQQFAMVPMNLLPQNAKAAYLDSGIWATKAIKECQKFGTVDVVASSKESNYTYVPKGYEIPVDASFFHYTSNNTIYGTELFDLPLSSVPIVSDMSSDILSRKLDVEKYGLIYAGAQKNIGPAGVSLVIVKDDLLGKSGRDIPSIFDYRKHAEAKSLYNTPPVFAIYVSLLTLRWLRAKGGIEEIERENLIKARTLYDEIDRNPLFKGTANIADRSRMNVTFVMNNPLLEKEFLSMVDNRGIVGLKGHRSVGGFRASIYNALPITSINVLVDTMQEFAEKHDPILSSDQ